MQLAIALALLLSPVSCLLSPCPAQDDPFAAGVRTTPWLKPEDEQKAFKLPPGFEINLVAAEPEIQKPLNMAFDERGRIWLTCSVEYPYAAPLDKPGRDSIRVLEDTDGDGRYEKMTVFADGLNIPIGIYPYKGGCIAWSIPNVWHFEDADGDGTCDKRTVLYGPFDHTRDTHGMCNAFRRGFDGWVYACHGFNNDSRVKGKDGHEVHLNSGNTFRFKLDGSRIEHFTHGQVNPFGMCFDELFNIFTADCHSKPLTQLIRGGYYPSFGRAHDGLGFVPSMMEHSHGSTAICGVVKYSGENFPKEYHGNFLSGNVMTSRINQNKPEYHGSTIKAIEQPDFLSTTDPWFRPVDLQIGPDGALYILDFYNRIIGHYEVPLPHPGRDRTSGRIWRIAYKGDAEGTKPAGKPREFDLTRMSLKEIVSQFEHPNLEFRLRAQHWLADVVTKTEDPNIWNSSEFRTVKDKPSFLTHWTWFREATQPLSADSFASLVEVSADSADRRNVTHDLKLLDQRTDWPDEMAPQLIRYLAHDDPFVRRAAADALALHPNPVAIRPLLEALSRVPAEDVLLTYSLKASIRDHLAAMQPRDLLKLNPRGVEIDQLATISLAVPNLAGAQLIVRFLDAQENRQAAELLPYVQHAARYADGGTRLALIDLARHKFTTDELTQAQIVQSIAAGLVQRGEAAPKELQNWAEQLAGGMLEVDVGDRIGWTAVPVEGKPASENPWVIAARPSADGDKDSLFFYSLPKGEQRTGIYRSGTFAIPEKLSFWCAGHSGFPGKPLNDGNYVRLRDATTHAVLVESRPPRNDTAQRFEWDLSKHAKAATSGRGNEAAPSPPAPLPRGERGEGTATTGRGYVELVDGDTAGAYAWLAVGRFSLAALNPSDIAKKQQLAAEIIGKLKLAALRPHLATLVAAPNTDGAARAAIAQALLSFEPSAIAAALVSALNEPAIPNDLRVAIGTTLTRSVSEGVPEETAKLYLDNLREVMKRAPSRLQTTIAETLAGDADGADALLALVESGHASPRLLLAASVSAKFGTLKNEKLDKRVAALTAKLPPVSETLDKLILERRVSFAKVVPNLEKGQVVFTKHCAGCHQIEGKGSVVGPQLDGIGGRGLERIIEDILDPNRNVDVAFRTTTIRKTDGQIVSGLFRREEGAQLVLADNQGKEFTVAKDDIDEQQKTGLSLMPANVPEIVPAGEFHDLVGYLLSKRAAGEKKQP